MASLATIFGLRAPFVLSACGLVGMLLVGGRSVSQRAFSEAYADAPAAPDVPEDDAVAGVRP